MSSSDRLNPQQLQMFMPAKELHVSDEDFGGDLVPGDYQPGRHGTYKKMWDEKLSQATATGELHNNPHYDPDNPLTSDDVADIEYFEDRGESPPPELTRDFEMTWEPKDSLQQGIKEGGITTPVKLAYAEDMAETWKAMGRTPKPPIVGQRVIVDGHHRIAAAHDLSPDAEIPIQYSKSSPQQDWTSDALGAKDKMERELDATSKAPDDRPSVTDVRQARDLLPPGNPKSN